MFTKPLFHGVIGGCSSGLRSQEPWQIPQILLMDESFGALDAQDWIRMQENLLKPWEDLKTTVEFVTPGANEFTIPDLDKLHP